MTAKAVALPTQYSLSDIATGLALLPVAIALLIFWAARERW